MEQIVHTDLSNTSSANSMPSEDVLRKSQVPMVSGFQPSHADLLMYPFMYHTLMSGPSLSQSQEQSDHGPGIYAVPVHSFMGPMTGLPPNTLIPLTYNIPTRPNQAGVVGEEQSQEARQHGPQRQVVVRRFQFAIQLDLFLLLKLAAVVFVFNQDGSRQRLILLLLFASLVYLYQTGALAPFLRWLRQAAVPPQPRPAVRQETGPLAVHDNGTAPPSEETPGVENENQPIENEGQPVENENLPEPGRVNVINWWGLAKEIQMFVVGFVTSLFPGFHHND